MDHCSIRTSSQETERADEIAANNCSAIITRLRRNQSGPSPLISIVQAQNRAQRLLHAATQPTAGKASTATDATVPVLLLPSFYTLRVVKEALRQDSNILTFARMTFSIVWVIFRSKR